MAKYGIGQPVARFEDPRLLRGQGRFINDVNIPGQAYCAMLRSPHAHARIVSVDTSTALAAPGVLAVYTEADLAADGLGTMRVSLPRKRPDGSPLFYVPHPGLARGFVRYVGDPVAMIVAETLAQARDAAELVAVAYEPLPSVTETARVLDPDAPAVWPDCPGNLSHIYEMGNKAATDAAIAGAAHVVRQRIVISRVYVHFLETRGAIGVYDPGEERFTLYADVQYPHRVRDALARNIFKIPESKIRVIAGDVGGGFGTKGWQYVEHRLTLYAARKLGRPVKWTSTRSEAIQSDEHARDNIADATLALDAGGKIVGLRVDTLCNVGAYISAERNLLSTFSNVSTLAGTYAIPTAYTHVDIAFSNSNPTAPYRGAGRPEATYVIERIIDTAAARLGIDRVDLRRRNLIPENAMPYRNPFGVNYDCGAFEKGMDQALALSDWNGYAARKAESAARGKHRGIGIVNAIERAASPGLEFAEIRFNPGGSAMVLMGSKNQGQGHETMFKQIVNSKLGLDPHEVQYIDGDTDRVAFGIGTMGSRSTVIGGSALTVAAGKILVKARKIAAHLLEAAETDLEFDDGSFTVAGTDKGITIKQVAMAAFQAPRLPPGMDPGLYETGTFSPKQDTYPNGCHVCEVEIDPDTGAVAVLRYAVSDDVGNVMNPTGLKGQIHGGVAQGLGQALMEQVAYDPESGQLLSGSLMDYAMPRADTTCDIEIVSNPVPTALNPLGAKGAGEAGTVGALPVVVNAVLDALRPLGVKDIEMPVTSERVWRAIQAGAA
jgi:carbon-monoxide dehydrogenase large subunit